MALRDLLFLIPLFMALGYGLIASPQRVFLNIFLPCLLLLPDYYNPTFPGVPDPSFVEAATLGTMAIFIFRGMPGYRFSSMDILVAAFTVLTALSELRAAGFKDAQNYTVSLFTGVLFPYLLAKSLLEPFGLSIAFAKRMVLICVGVSVVSVLEFTTGINPWRRFFDRIYPWGTSLGQLSRWGFFRIAGPYGHTIWAGMVLGTVWLIQYWLHGIRAWQRPRWLPLPSRLLSWLLTLTLLGGVIMTFSRGPWLGLIIGIVLAGVGFTRFRWLTLTLILVAVIGIAIPAVQILESYASVGRQAADSATQETAAYRWELLVNYIEVGMEKPVWGWGRLGWPKNPAQPSIDNHYLLLFLMHGLLGMGTFVLVMLYSAIRLLLYAMAQPPGRSPTTAIAFMFVGVVLGSVLTIGTVALLLQAVPVLFLMIGWGEGVLANRHRSLATSTTASTQPTAPQPYRFRRVLQ